MAKGSEIFRRRLISRRVMYMNLTIYTLSFGFRIFTEETDSILSDNHDRETFQRTTLRGRFAPNHLEFRRKRSPSFSPVGL